MNTHIKNLIKDLRKSEATSVNHCAQAEATEDQLHLKILSLEERVRELE